MADESLLALDFMVKTRLFTSQIVLQIILGTLVPLAMLFAIQLMKFSENARKRMYVTSGLLTLIGILAGLSSSAIGRNPDAAGQIRGLAIILAAFAEGLGVLAVVVGLLAIFIK